MKINEIMEISPVIPVVTFSDINHCSPLAYSLLSSGIRIIEITLRSEISLKAIEKIASEFPDLTVGAGTVLSKENVVNSISSGAKFLVSPGVNADLENITYETDIPFLPGVSSVTEMMRLSEIGYSYLKFFPAVASGGVEYLKAVYPVLPNLKFCPTGGIDENNCLDWLNLPNVTCIGGSLIASDKLIRNQNWSEIEKRAVWASKLKS